MSPTPIQSFVGGIGLAIPIYSLLILNGDVFGISGFLHRAVRGTKEPIVGVAGLVSGGALVGIIEGGGSNLFTVSFPQVLLSGFLVGLGSKLSNGCTSGHMIAGVSRFSPRSIVATATFFSTAVITSQILHRDLPSVGNVDWTLGTHGKALLAFQAIPLAISALLYFFSPPRSPSPSESTVVTEPNTSLRLFALFCSAFEFALALRLSNLNDPTRVLSFLLLPVHKLSFDPSLAFLAAGALPLSALLYHFCRQPEKPRLGGRWGVPRGGQIDGKLVTGAALFGVGWGIAGVCPGPGLVNVGRALVGGPGLTQIASWLGAVVLGGLLV